MSLWGGWGQWREALLLLAHLGLAGRRTREPAALGAPVEVPPVAVLHELGQVRVEGRREELGVLGVAPGHGSEDRRDDLVAHQLVAGEGGVGHPAGTDGQNERVAQVDFPFVVDCWLFGAFNYERPVLYHSLSTLSIVILKYPIC